MQYIVTEEQFHQMKNYDETNKMAHNSQIIRAKEKLKIIHGGPIQRQTSGLAHHSRLKRKT